MSMDRKDGGPAFPSHGSMGEVTHEGATLRDWFAAHASDADIRAAIDENPSAMLTRPQARYAYADAMLRAREA